MKDEMSQKFVDNGSLHRYRTELPNVILDLDLDLYELTVYLHMKRIAGDYGSCFYSNKTLAEKCRMSLRKFIQAKNSLSKRGLIKITQRIDDKKVHQTCVVEIVDIWEKNFDHFRQKKEIKHEGGVVHHMHGGHAPGAHKEELIIKKEPYKSPYPRSGRKDSQKSTQKKQKETPRSKGTNPRALGINPRAKGANLREAEEKNKAFAQKVEACVAKQVRIPVRFFYNKTNLWIEHTAKGAGVLIPWKYSEKEFAAKLRKGLESLGFDLSLPASKGFVKSYETEENL